MPLQSWQNASMITAFLRTSPVCTRSCVCVTGDATVKTSLPNRACVQFTDTVVNLAIATKTNMRTRIAVANLCVTVCAWF